MRELTRRGRQQEDELVASHLASARAEAVVTKMEREMASMRERQVFAGRGGGGRMLQPRNRR